MILIDQFENISLKIGTNKRNKGGGLYFNWLGNRKKCLIDNKKYINKE